jgi:TPR repeat protein
LAGLCYRGDELERNVTEAIGWYEKAAKKGHAEAVYNLGTIYEYGLGVQPNRTRATEWYLRASNAPQGD